MAEKFVKREKLPTKSMLIGENSITVKAALHRADTQTSTSSAVILIPGWSMEGHSRGLTKMAQSFSKSTGNTVVTISTDFPDSTSATPSKQVVALNQYIEPFHFQSVIIVGHSEGTTNALALAKQLESRRQEGDQVPTVDGVVLMTPIGLTPHAPSQIVKELGKAAFLHIPKGTVVDIAAARRGVGKFFDAGIIGLTMAKNIARDVLQRGPRRYIRHVRQEITNMTAQLENHLQAPLVFALGQHDNVVPTTSAKEQITSRFPNAHILIFDQFGHHGMPYQQHETIAQQSIVYIRRGRS